jgi:hypothetical protein
MAAWRSLHTHLAFLQELLDTLAQDRAVRLGLLRPRAELALHCFGLLLCGLPFGRVACVAHLLGVLGEGEGSGERRGSCLAGVLAVTQLLELLQAGEGQVKGR